MGESIISELGLKKYPLYPLRTHEAFSSDPLAVLLNAFSKIERDGGGAAVQFLFRHPKQSYRSTYEEIVKRVKKGMKPGEAIRRSSLAGEMMAGVGELFFSSAKPKDDTPPEPDQEALNSLRKSRRAIF